MAGLHLHVRAALAAAHPVLVPLLPTCRFAIGTEFAEEGDVVPPGAEVAIIPPVSGG
jgi:molybdopterin synthase catalytic subunit